MAELIAFDFERDKGMEALKRLENILCSPNWGRSALDYRDKRTILLIQLIRMNGLLVYEHRYTPNREYTEETRREAEILSHIFRMRSVNQTMFDLLELFPDQEPDTRTREHNALFYPGLNAFIRCGDLNAERMFELFEYDDCEKIIIFPNLYISDTEDAYYIFELAMPKQTLLKVLGEMREERQRELSEALIRANEKRGSPFPPLPKEDSETE